MTKKSNKNINKFFFVIIWFLIIVWPLSESSAQDYPYDIDQYAFINYKHNKLDFYGDSIFFENLFLNLNNLVIYGFGQMNIIHIGGSHIQADIFSGRIRQRLQTFYPGLNAGRGFVFPYRVAKTNTPVNYYVRYTGNWESCRNVEKIKNCNLGLSGISVTTFDSISTIQIILKDKNYLHYEFNRLKIFQELDSLSFSVFLNNPNINYTVIDDYSCGCKVFILDDYIDTLSLRIVKTNEFQRAYTLYGISLETDDPGIVYHSIGVNGASVPSYLRCNMFNQHLQALNPDLTILSIGINDAYTRDFKPEIFERNYDSLLTKIREVAPNAPIILTVNNDSYLYRRYTNTNVIKVREVMVNLSKKHHCAVWDLHTIMGGLNSIVYWNLLGLAKKDKHFTSA
ncbi:GDSL-type esterase/lipase family protein [candidate division KSB1 bacterium]